MLKKCPSAPPFGCSCDLVQVDGPLPSPSPAGAPAGSGPLKAVIVEVYCDDRNLTEFPPHLPDNTTSLYIRNNR